MISSPNRKAAPFAALLVSLSLCAAAIGTFAIAPAAPSTPPAATTTGTVCPGVFQVEHNDCIAALPFPAGNYVVTSLRGTCASNVNAFKRLLARSSSTARETQITRLQKLGLNDRRDLHGT